MSNGTRNPGESKAAPTLLSLHTIGARLTMVEHCIVRSNADAADQIRELARLLGGVVDYLEHRDGATAQHNAAHAPTTRHLDLQISMLAGRVDTLARTVVKLGSLVPDAIEHFEREPGDSDPDRAVGEKGSL